MKTYATYGFLWALAGAILTLALFFFGYHSDADRLQTAQRIAMVVGLAIAVAFIVLGTKARRSEIPPEAPFGYGQALVAGILVALFGTVFSLIFNYIYMQFINSGMNELIVQAQLDKMEESGLSSAQVEGAETMMRKMMHPAIQAAMGLVGGMFFSTLIALVTAAFLKRKPVESIVSPTVG